MPKASARRSTQPSDLATLWFGALEELRHQMTAPAWQAWLKNSQLVGLQDGVGVLGVPSPMAANWIAEHHEENIVKTLSGILGHAIAIEYEVVEGLGASAVKQESVEAPTEVGAETAGATIIPLAPARMEYHLGRHALWDTQPLRDAEHLEFQYRGEDVNGTFIIDYALGRLSVADMELVAWLQGRWDLDRDGDTVVFSAREYVRDSGSSWAGWRAAAIRESLRRIHRTNMTIMTWDEKSKKRSEKNVSILADTDLTDKSSTLTGVGTGHRITVRLSKWLIEQLRNNQSSPLNFKILTTSLTTPLARRLYVFLESQKGFGPNGDYAITIDSKLHASLGVRDTASRHQARLRERLARAGEEIVAADSRYVLVTVRPGKRRVWVLEVKRRAATVALPR